MTAERLVALLCCDLGAVVRGRSIPASDLERRWETGVGWVPANQSLTPLGGIAEPNPFGAMGDLRLRPDAATRLQMDLDRGAPALDFVLCDIVTIDGEPWRCCPRAFLRDALERLRAQTGARALVSFEHEFQLLGDEPPEAAFSLAAQRQAEPFPSSVMAALSAAGLEPESFVPEYGAHQFEVPCAPAEGLGGADRSVMFKEVVREVARQIARRVTFTPVLEPTAVGNGAHIHVSLVDDAGHPLLYDPTRPGRLSELGGSFAAGILHHAASLTALVAGSPVSALRLAPQRWSAAAACVGHGNREALLRIPPVLERSRLDPARQFNLEFRAADATANPYLALGAIIRAGLEGVSGALPAPPVLDRDLAALTPGERDRLGIGRLPGSLEEALIALDGDLQARSWLDPQLHETFVGVKRAELAAVQECDVEERCRRYALVY